MNAKAELPDDPTPDLTEKQREVFIAMLKFYVAEDQLPPARMIREYVDDGNRGQAGNYHIDALERKGYIERNRCMKKRLTEKGWKAAKALIGLEPPRLTRVEGAG